MRGTHTGSGTAVHMSAKKLDEDSRAERDATFWTRFNWVLPQARAFPECPRAFPECPPSPRAPLDPVPEESEVRLLPIEFTHMHSYIFAWIHADFVRCMHT